MTPIIRSTSHTLSRHILLFTTMSSFLRQAVRQVSSVRAFSSSSVARKDLVQDLYIREIKAYKQPPTAKDAHVGVVKAFALPPSPQAPTVPADLASELSAYDASEPTIAAAPTPSAGVEDTGAASGADQFLSFLEADLPKVEHHH